MHGTSGGTPGIRVEAFRVLRLGTEEYDHLTSLPQVYTSMVCTISPTPVC